MINEDGAGLPPAREIASSWTYPRKAVTTIRGKDSDKASGSSVPAVSTTVAVAPATVQLKIFASWPDADAADKAQDSFSDSTHRVTPSVLSMFNGEIRRETILIRNMSGAEVWTSKHTNINFIRVCV